MILKLIGCTDAVAGWLVSALAFEILEGRESFPAQKVVARTARTKRTQTWTTREEGGTTDVRAP